MNMQAVLNFLTLAGLSALVAFAPLGAQQASTYVPPPQYQAPQGHPPTQALPPPPASSYYVSPMEFLPTFGRKFGDLFRRVFYGDAPPPGQSQQGYPPGRVGRSLDQPPSGYSRITPPPALSTPRYEAPPRQQAPPRSETPLVERQPSEIPPPSESPKSRPATRSQPPVTKPSTVPPPSPQAATTPQSSTSNPAAESPPRQEPKPAKKEATDAPPSSTPEKKPESAPSGGAFLKGKRTNKPGRVISPYPPYQELDVSGLSSGSLALDPTTQKVFEVP